MPILNILTPATPRPEIHRFTIYHTITKIRNRFDIPIRWYVNVDCPSMFTESQRTETMNSMISFSKEKDINLRIVRKIQGGHFGRAGRRLFRACDQTIDRSEQNIFFWLEDDWMIVEFQVEKFMNMVEEFFTNDKDFILTTDLKYVTGNPLVFKQPFFDQVAINYGKQHDPEVVLHKSVKNYYNIDDSRRDFDVSRAMITRYPIFCDLGMAWRETNNIAKRTKKESISVDHTWYKPDEPFVHKPFRRKMKK